MGDLKELLFARTLAAYNELRERQGEAPAAIFHNRECRDALKRFSALYSLVVDAKLEAEYQAWKETALAILPDVRTTNFEEITETPEALASFLEKLNAVDAPWERDFESMICPACPFEDCPDECPEEDKRSSPAWWLRLPAEE